METLVAHFNTETKINLALSYENPEITRKFSTEYGVDHELSIAYFLELKKFLYLCANSTEKLAPSAEIDKIWHTFILFTKDYRQYCMHFLGKFIDHVPEVAQSEEDPFKENNAKENYLQNTVNQYEKVFGELDNSVWQLTSKNMEDEIHCHSEAECTSSGCESCSSCSSCEGRRSQPSCVFTGNCFSCTDSGYSCVGENPNDL